MNYIVPILVFIIILYGFVKKRNIYEDFMDGVKEGLDISVKLIPSIFAMIVSVSIFINSNFLEYIINFNGIYKELVPLGIMRSISGSSSLVMMENIFNKYGVDSNIGIIASVITASTDTTLYIIGTYFGSINIKKTRYALLVGILADIICVIVSYIVVMV